jgi:hypothetical protein
VPAAVQGLFEVCCSAGSCLGVAEYYYFLRFRQSFHSLCSLFESDPHRPQLGIKHLHLSFPEVAAEDLPAAFAVAAYGRCSHSPIITLGPIRPPCMGVRMFFFRPLLSVLFSLIFLTLLPLVPQTPRRGCASSWCRLFDRACTLLAPL